MRAMGVAKKDLGLKDFTLVICEKPAAAQKIADALASKAPPQKREIYGVPLYEVNGDGEGPYLVCAALGHLYTVEDPFGNRKVYPVLDVEWRPIQDAKRRSSIANRIKLFQELSKGAKRLINACDFDLEGETIAYNILKYACHGREGEALRAKFSTLTKQELKRSFSKLEPTLALGLAKAGRARHTIDFLYGVNLSRALIQSFQRTGAGYRTISIGRVQGPTLAYVVEREVEIRTFVPLPYWSLKARLMSGGIEILAQYEKGEVPTLKEAQSIKSECEGREALLKEVKVSRSPIPPPPPFNTGDLQREAYRLFGIPPQQTLSIAERLYLEALISYPRTNSQKLPPSIDYVAIMKGLARMEPYANLVRRLKLPLKPREGDKEDPAHPAIYPTGEVPKRDLEGRELRLYDLIVKRFLSAFGEEALKEAYQANFYIDGHKFKASFSTLVKRGWTELYTPYASYEERAPPALREGEFYKVLEVLLDEKFHEPPRRYNPARLLAKMEEEGIGTKATRGEIIKTLYDRQYIVGQQMVATDLAFEVVAQMRRSSPLILSSEMTRRLEQELELIELGSARDDQVVERAIDALLPSLEALYRSTQSRGRELREALRSTDLARRSLGDCPICKEGKLIILRSRRSEKRFVGCTNHPKGCDASSSLPQRGSISPTGRICQECGWPIILVRSSRRPWLLCCNIHCPSRAKALKSRV